MSYLKGEKVRINSLVTLQQRDAAFGGDQKEYSLHIGEIFVSTDYSTPDNMDSLAVYCVKRGKGFHLPMGIVERIGESESEINLYKFQLGIDFPKCLLWLTEKGLEKVSSANIADKLEEVLNIHIVIYPKVVRKKLHFEVSVLQLATDNTLSKSFLLEGGYWAYTNQESPKMYLFDDKDKARNSALKRVLSNIEKDL